MFSWPRAGLATLSGWSILLLYICVVIHKDIYVQLFQQGMDQLPNLLVVSWTGKVTFFPVPALAREFDLVRYCINFLHYQVVVVFVDSHVQRIVLATEECSLYELKYSVWSCFYNIPGIIVVPRVDSCGIILVVLSYISILVCQQGVLTAVIDIFCTDGVHCRESNGAQKQQH